MSFPPSSSLLGHSSATNSTFSTSDTFTKYRDPADVTGKKRGRENEVVNENDSIAKVLGEEIKESGGSSGSISNSTSSGVIPHSLQGAAPKFSQDATSFKVVNGGGNGKQNTEKITDPKVIAFRTKQISYGKNTIGYDNYIASVPIKCRSRNRSIHPRTPDPEEMCSKRSFEGRLAVWRRALHQWDNVSRTGTMEVVRSCSTGSIGDGYSLEGALEAHRKKLKLAEAAAAEVAGGVGDLIWGLSSTTTKLSSEHVVSVTSAASDAKISSEISQANATRDGGNEIVNENENVAAAKVFPAVEVHGPMSESMQDAKAGTAGNDENNQDDDDDDDIL